MGGFLALIFFLILIAGVVGILIYNGIISSKNTVIRSWSDVVTYQRQKIKLLPDLERLTRDYMGFEQTLLTGVAELRSAIAKVSPARIDVQAIEEVEARTDSLLAGFRAVVENYPELRSADLVRDLMAEMIELEENIAAAVTIFNRNVASFNSGIEMFPNSIINGTFTRLQPYPAFRDSAAESGFEYQFRG